MVGLKDEADPAIPEPRQLQSRISRQILSVEPDLTRRGHVQPTQQCSSVLLPAPEAPRTTRNSPRDTWRSTFRSTSSERLPIQYVFPTLRAFTNGPWPRRAAVSLVAPGSGF